MIGRGDVISNALLRLGEIGYYNNNSSPVYTRAEALLDVVLKNVARDNTLLFNATTVKLTSIGENAVTEEYEFNVPVDMLNLVRTVPVADVRLEGQKFLSNCEEVIVQYCRDMPLTNYPDYMEEYLTVALAVEMARTHNTYVERLMYFEDKLMKEKAQIEAIEGFDALVPERTLTMYEVEVLRKYGKL